jgi:hypothetical protein
LFPGIPGKLQNISRLEREISGIPGKFPRKPGIAAFFLFLVFRELLNREIWKHYAGHC